MPRRKRDLELGNVLAQINMRDAPQQIRAANPNPTAQQVSSYSRAIAPVKGTERAFSTFGTKNTTAGNPRAGQQRQTFVKRDDEGNIYKYHQYVQNGKRKVFRVGGPLNRKASA